MTHKTNNINEQSHTIMTQSPLVVKGLTLTINGCAFGSPNHVITLGFNSSKVPSGSFCSVEVYLPSIDTKKDLLRLSKNEIEIIRN